LVISIWIFSKINPADCVDMECDAKKKVIIKDEDGSFLGGVGTVLPDVSLEWVYLNV